MRRHCAEMTLAQLSLDLNSPIETERLARKIASRLEPGDCVLLQGPIGAGKTHFARSLIQSLLVQFEDVPSPTFTLVQTYETSIGELWHADLYRLSSLDEFEELGLTDAFETAACIVEWPEILGSLTPQNALHVTLVPDLNLPEQRHISFGWTNPEWATKLEFLEHA